MILRNWMERDPQTTTSDTLVSDALQMLLDKDLRTLPVVDEGKLRGLVTRKILQGCAAAVARAQDQYETEYFINRLKVKDIMIRMPKTVEASDTVERAMLSGQKDMVRNYPVLEGGNLVGMVSSFEIFDALGKILGANEIWCGITLKSVEIKSGVLSKVSSVVEEAGGTLHGLFTMSLPDTVKKRVIIRFQAVDIQKVARALTEAGFVVKEMTKEVQSCSTANGAS